jgi:hypothetical protein
VLLGKLDKGPEVAPLSGVQVYGGTNNGARGYWPSIIVSMTMVQTFHKEVVNRTQWAVDANEVDRE